MKPDKKLPMMTEQQVRVLMALYEKEWKNESNSENIQTEYFLRHSTLELVLGDETSSVSDAIRVSTQFKNDASLRLLLKEIEDVQK
jgi:hypothetical protein